MGAELRGLTLMEFLGGGGGRAVELRGGPSTTVNPLNNVRRKERKGRASMVD